MPLDKDPHENINRSRARSPIRFLFRGVNSPDRILFNEHYLAMYERFRFSFADIASYNYSISTFFPRKRPLPVTNLSALKLMRFSQSYNREFMKHQGRLTEILPNTQLSNKFISSDEYSLFC